MLERAELPTSQSRKLPQVEFPATFADRKVAEAWATCVVAAILPDAQIVRCDSLPNRSRIELIIFSENDPLTLEKIARRIASASEQSVEVAATFLERTTPLDLFYKLDELARTLNVKLHSVRSSATGYEVKILRDRAIRAETPLDPVKALTSCAHDLGYSIIVRDSLLPASITVERLPFQVTLPHAPAASHPSSPLSSSPLPVEVQISTSAFARRVAAKVLGDIDALFPDLPPFLPCRSSPINVSILGQTIRETAPRCAFRIEGLATGDRLEVVIDAPVNFLESSELVAIQRAVLKRFGHQNEISFRVQPGLDTQLEIADGALSRRFVWQLVLDNGGTPTIYILSRDGVATDAYNEAQLTRELRLSIDPRLVLADWPLGRASHALTIRGSSSREIGSPPWVVAQHEAHLIDGVLPPSLFGQARPAGNAIVVTCRTVGYSKDEITHLLGTSLPHTASDILFISSPGIVSDQTFRRGVEDLLAIHGVRRGQVSLRPGSPGIRILDAEVVLNENHMMRLQIALDQMCNAVDRKMFDLAPEPTGSIYHELVPTLGSAIFTWRVIDSNILVSGLTPLPNLSAEFVAAGCSVQLDPEPYPSQTDTFEILTTLQRRTSPICFDELHRQCLMIHEKVEHFCGVTAAVVGNAVVVTLDACPPPKLLETIVTSLEENDAPIVVRCPIGGQFPADGFDRIIRESCPAGIYLAEMVPVPDGLKVHIFTDFDENSSEFKIFRQSMERVCSVGITWEIQALDATFRTLMGVATPSFSNFSSAVCDSGGFIREGAVVDLALDYFYPPIVQKVPDSIALIGHRRLIRERAVSSDPRTAWLHEDAISISHDNNGALVISVHLSDPSPFVSQGSLQDLLLRRQGNSLYAINGRATQRSFDRSILLRYASFGEAPEVAAVTVTFRLGRDGRIDYQGIELTRIEQCDQIPRETIDEQANLAPQNRDPFVNQLEEIARRMGPKGTNGHRGVKFDSKVIDVVLRIARRQILHHLYDNGLSAPIVQHSTISEASSIAISEYARQHMPGVAGGTARLMFEANRRATIPGLDIGATDLVRTSEYCVSPDTRGGTPDRDSRLGAGGAWRDYAAMYILRVLNNGNQQPFVNSRVVNSLNELNRWPGRSALEFDIAIEARTAQQLFSSTSISGVVSGHDDEHRPLICHSSFTSPIILRNDGGEFTPVGSKVSFRLTHYHLPHRQAWGELISEG